MQYVALLKCISFNVYYSSFNICCAESRTERTNNQNLQSPDPKPEQLHWSFHLTQFTEGKSWDRIEGHLANSCCCLSWHLPTTDQFFKCVSLTKKHHPSCRTWKCLLLKFVLLWISLQMGCKWINWVQNPKEGRKWGPLYAWHHLDFYCAFFLGFFF